MFLLDTAKVATYLGDELHLAFNFPPLFEKWRAAPLGPAARRRGHPHRAGGLAHLGAVQPRRAPVTARRYGSEARARAAAVLLLGLRGTPFLFAGEELGLEDAEVPAERVVDPGGRDGCRAPLPWDASAGHGWGEGEPWLPWPPGPVGPQRRGPPGGPGVDPAPLPGAAGRPEGVARPPGRRRRPGSTRPTACWCGSGPSTAIDRLVAVNFTEEPVAGAGPRRHGRGQQRPIRRGRRLLRHPRPGPGGLAATRSSQTLRRSARRSSAHPPEPDRRSRTE